MCILPVLLHQLVLHKETYSRDVVPLQGKLEGGQ